MDKQLRTWLKEQIRAIENGELDDKRRMMIVELMDSKTGLVRQEMEEVLNEVLNEKKKKPTKRRR